MAKLIDEGWVKESDPRYKEGWTVSVTLGLSQRTRGEEATPSKPPPPPKQGKPSKARRGD